MHIRGILFDKDGTLFDFDATWSQWAAKLLRGLANGDEARAQGMADAVGYDLAQATFRPGSVVVAGTPAEIVTALLPFVPGVSDQDLFDRINAEAALAPQISPLALPPFLTRLRDQGYVLGVATNDAEAPALAHLDQAGIRGFFPFIAGSDSGFGTKPGAGMCKAFLAQTGLSGSEAVMVGDSTHDLHAGRAAGMHTVGVLTGYAKATTLAPLADAVMHSIADLPAWLDASPGKTTKNDA